MIIFLRSLAFNLFFYIGTLIWACFILTIFYLPRNAIRSVAKFWSRLLVLGLKYIIGLDYQLHGTENIPKTPCVFACKHQSTWETFALFCFLPDINYITKMQIFSIPLIGWAIKRVGLISLEGKRGRKALPSFLHKCRLSIEHGSSIVIFPEGTRVPAGKRGRYKSGVAMICAQLDIPCVPIALNSGLFWPRRSFMKRPGVVQVYILPPLDPRELNRKALIKKLKKQIENVAQKLI